MSPGRPFFTEECFVKILNTPNDRRGESPVIFIYDTFPREEW